MKLRRAYELSNDPRILWNIALCEEQLRHYAEATRTLESGGPFGRSLKATPHAP